MLLRGILLIALALYHSSASSQNGRLTPAPKGNQHSSVTLPSLTSDATRVLKADTDKEDRTQEISGPQQDVTRFEGHATWPLTQTYDYGSSTVDQNEGAIEDWQVAIERTQFVMTCLGFFANVVSLVSLIHNRQMFSSSFALLLKHQSLVDSGVCVMAGIVLVQPKLWTSGILWLDVFVCLGWHSQAIFYFAILISVWNLVYISAERYIAVCLPFSYTNLTLRKVRYAIFFLYPLSLLAASLSFVQNTFDFDEDVCLMEFMITGKTGEKVFYAYAIFALFFSYLIPVVINVVVFSKILYTLKVRSTSSDLAASQVIESATDSMTKSAIALTLVFIFSIGFDLWYYTLGYTGVVSYEVNSPVQKVGVFLAVFNSCVNPCVYAVLMPAYRNSVKKTFLCKRCTQNSTTSDAPQGSEAIVSLSMVSSNTLHVTE